MPGITDLSPLADRAPGGPQGHVAVRIPYATRQGNLTVRSWLRAPHAEVAELRPEDGGLAVRGRLYGIPFAPGAYAELRARPGAFAGGVRRPDVVAGRTEFAFTVPYDTLTPGVWDVWLRPAGESGPLVRLARLLDDVADKQLVLPHPRVRLETPYGPVAVGPRYTGDNDLELTVAPLEP